MNDRVEFCDGVIEHVSIRRCPKVADFTVRPYQDISYGTHCCSRHLAQVVRSVVDSYPGCEPIVRVLEEKR